MKRNVCITILFFMSLYFFSENNKFQNEYFISITEGSPLYSIEDGKLLSYGYDFNYGNYIEINYPTIGIIVKYCNLGQIKYFFDKTIKKGDLIAKSGISGNIEDPGVTIIITLTDLFLNENSVKSNNEIHEGFQ